MLYLAKMKSAEISFLPIGGNHMEAFTQPGEDDRLARIEDRLSKELERKRLAEADLQKRKEHLHRIDRNIRTMQSKRKELIGEKILSLGCQTPEELQALFAAVTEQRNNVEKEAAGIAEGGTA